MVTAFESENRQSSHCKRISRKPRSRDDSHTLLISVFLMKIGVAQVGTPKSWQPQDAILKLREYVENASEQGVEHLVFPEAFIGGYPKFSNFGTHVGDRKPEGRKEFAKYYKGAITVPGPYIDQIVEIAEQNKIFLVVGVIEKEEIGGTLYCTAVFIHPEKGYVGKHRKVSFVQNCVQT